MYHCHLLHHEDDGMMGQFLVTTGSIGIKENESKENNINVYPNPSSGSIVIANSQKADEMKVTDILGNIIYEIKLPEQKTTLFIESAGVYFITVISGKETSIKKIIQLRLYIRKRYCFNKRYRQYP